MTDRWKEKLGALDRTTPDGPAIRALAAQGPRMPEPPERRGTRVLAAVVALGVAAGALAFVVSAFDDGTQQVSSDLDPATICEVPGYDPEVALLVGQPVRQVPLADLKGPGQRVDDLDGPAADEVRAYVASDAGRNAPHDGWRQVTVEGDEVVYVSPMDPGDWWILGFTEQPDGDWRMSEEEIVEQAQTPAQRGHDLRLEWDGPLVLDDGDWNEPLRLVNGRADTWVEDGWGRWGIVHVFARGDGTEIGGGRPIASSWGSSEIPAGGSIPVPAALGDHLVSLTRGTYDVVACVADLGLASPVGTLEVGSPGVVPDVTVMTYPGTTGMLALGGGSLTVEDGCLTLGGGAGRTTHVLWPNGYALVERDGRQVLIDAIGDEVAEPGDEMTVGGGWAHLPWAEDLVIGGIPDACRVGGESYFVTSGPTDAG